MSISNPYNQNNQPAAIGRMELAQSYFPFLLPRSAWKKFKTPEKSLKPGVSKILIFLSLKIV